MALLKIFLNVFKTSLKAKIPRGLYIKIIFMILMIASCSLLARPTEDKDSKQILLEEGWQLIYGQLILQPDSLKNQKPITVKAPHAWHGQKVAGQHLERHGFGTYHLRIPLPENIADPAIYIPTTGTNYRLWANQHYLGGVGQVGTNKKEAIPFFEAAIYPLPSGSDSVDLVIQISNFHYRKGGLWRVPVVSSLEKLEKAKNRRQMIDIFLIGSILMLALYHLGANLPGLYNKESLYFSLICLAAVLRISCNSEYLIASLLPGLAWEFYIRCEFSSFFIMAGLVPLFMLHVFKDLKLSKWPFLPFFYAYIAMALVSILFPVTISSYLIPIGQGLTVVMLSVAYVVLIPHLIRGDKEVIIFLSGSTILVLAVINFMLGFSDDTLVHQLVSFGIFTFFFASSVIIARRFSLVFKDLSETQNELKNVNQTLEKQVIDRTHELNLKNQSLQEKNQQLEKINRSLDEAIDEKDGLVSVVAHDLKSPLSRNKALIGLLRAEGPINPQQEEILRLLARSTANGLDLIRDLLELYALESGPQLEPGPIQLKSFGEDFLKGFSEVLNKKNMQVLQDFP